MELITSYGTIFLILACIFGLFMAWGIGANDVANAMGTSVGSGAITIKQAVLIAAVFEFAGAFLLGSAVYVLYYIYCIRTVQYIPNPCHRYATCVLITTGRTQSVRVLLIMDGLRVNQTS